MYSPDLAEFMRWWEGTPGSGKPALIAYWDALGQVFTIGYGRTTNVKEGDTCTFDQAEAWLATTLAATSVSVDGATNDVTQSEFDALVSFTYNLGFGHYYASTLREDVNLGMISAAGNEFCRWDHAGGHEVAGLLKRRVSEQHIFLYADYTGRP